MLPFVVILVFQEFLLPDEGAMDVYSKNDTQRPFFTGHGGAGCSTRCRRYSL
jgi:hypothetical protein